MKAINKLLVILVCFISVNAFGQSYEVMQSRFEKKSLDPQDSAAFIESGIQKAKTLFEYNDVYLKNTSNNSNQIYVEQKVPELFYEEEGDSLDLDIVMQLAQEIVQNQLGKPVEIKFTEKEGVLGQVETVNTKPTFQADLILVKVKKSFGTTSKKVWQVFLADPVFTP